MRSNSAPEPPYCAAIGGTKKTHLSHRMHAECHGFLQCFEQVLDIRVLDIAHGGDLEDFVCERAFSAVDDEAAQSECFAEFGEVHAFWEANA